MIYPNPLAWIRRYGHFLGRGKTLSFNESNIWGDSTRGALYTPGHYMLALIWMPQVMYCTLQRVG
jgi:hypothetical protein